MFNISSLFFLGGGFLIYPAEIGMHFIPLCILYTVKYGIVWRVIWFDR